MSGLLNQFTSDERKKLAVWAKGRIILGYDAAVWRHDENGAVMKYSEHGNRNSPHGWEMDHHPIPKALGGGDDISNLRPLHCVANASNGGVLGALLSR